jgi:hypothetical protein
VTRAVTHNDAVVQGLSVWRLMRGLTHWGSSPLAPDWATPDSLTADSAGCMMWNRTEPDPAAGWGAAAMMPRQPWQSPTLSPRDYVIAADGDD